jgi:ATP-dependent hsl protease ATP-binding subunit hslU
MELMMLKLLITALLLATSLFALEGRVVKVYDGDTITLLDKDMQQHRIRFYGIDAPEKSQSFGKRSQENLANMIAGKMVNVDVQAEDRYGRSVGIVYLDDVDINKRQVADGYAWAYMQYGGEIYKNDELRAREKKLGMWTDPNIEMPSEYRKRQKNGGNSSSNSGTTASEKAMETFLKAFVDAIIK